MLIIDSNLLLLWVVGSVNRQWITSFKRTNAYSESDFDTLSDQLQRHGQVTITPNIATEVSNLLGAASGKRRLQLYTRFAAICREFNEQYIPTQRMAESLSLLMFGLTDAAIESAAMDCQATVLTDDLPLARRLAARQINVVNFANLRTY